MELIIVESPTKAKTISKFLNKNYQVESSFGHIRDLPTKELGVDIENNFLPKYTVPAKAKKVATSLKAMAKKANAIILASDEDREGEAIAWHLTQVLNIDPKKTQRIVFHEITQEALFEALKSPRQLNFDMVDAQQARRVLDRLVGYKLSPFLWKKVAKGLSAGRVQSVATRLIIEREKEIKNFNIEEYWTISADLENKNQDKLKVVLIKINKKSFDKLEIKEEQALSLKKSLESASYEVFAVEKKEATKKAAAPFTTSTLQQTANRYLGYSAKQTMTLAQKLYENGHITYMRTDSVHLSEKFIQEAATWINKNLGEKYYHGKKIFKNKSRNAQEAHEAIRPTDVNLLEGLNKKLESNEFKLYKLIWQRAVASQIADAQLDATTINVLAKNKKDEYLLKVNGQVIKFNGYLEIWPEKTKEEILPNIKKGEKLNLIKIINEKHQTNPPARYSDAGLVKEMEKHGIGRPSTYAPTIATIITRNYVERDESKRLKPTEIAFVVTELLINHFPKIIDYKFTAQMEENLDLIANGQKKWQPIIQDFYNEFANNLENKYQEINKKDIMPIEESQEKCDKCGAKMLIKTGRYGKFLACSAFPECKNIKKIKKEGDENKVVDAKIIELEKKHANTNCDKCGAEMKVKIGKYGPFLACSAYPKCKNIKNISSNDAPTVKCPICNQGEIVKKISKRGIFYACNNYPQCKNAYQGEPTGKICPKCQALMIFNKGGQEKCSNKDCE